MKLSIHAGLPKTGSSAIQSWMKIHSEELWKKKVSYPVFHGMAAHVNIVNALRRDKLTSRLPEVQIERGAENLIISSEGLSANWHRFSERSKSDFAKWVSLCDSAHLYLVERKNPSWAVSFYKQVLCNRPGDKSFSTGTGISFEQFIALPVVQQLMQPDVLAAEMAAELKCDFTLLPFEKLSAEDVLSEMTGLPVTDFTGLKRVNSSFSSAEAELIRRTNSVCMAGPWHREVYLRELSNVLPKGNLALNLYARSEMPVLMSSGFCSSLQREPAQQSDDFIFEENDVQSMIDAFTAHLSKVTA